LALGALGWWWLTRRPAPVPPPAPPPFLSAVPFSGLPGWRDAKLDAALDAFRRSCAVIAQKPPAEIIADYAGTAAEWQNVCAKEAGAARAYFEKNFTPYAFSGEGLFTGYYEPEIRGSRTPQGKYQTPVYGLPTDLIQADLSQFSQQFKGEHIFGRLSGRKLVPYADRADIDARGLPTARILFWCDDPVALFFLQIQGSGRVLFADGSSARIAYAGANGRPYTAIGRVLLAKGELEKEKISLATIRDWLKAHPQQAQGVMEANQSFIFFEEKALGDTALGTNGVQGVPLTPMGSMAIDLRKNALGVPYYVAADPVTALLIAQDTGGAIRGQVRGDVYFGFGAKAEQQAGEMKAQGRMFVLLPNAVAARLGKSFSP
jgi:membrane-bound lytic murein transglycosylase A